MSMAALVIAAITITQRPTSPNANASPDLADQDWAKAIWLSLPFSEGDSEEASAAFATALRQAKHKAPIYVAMGDADSGPQLIGEMVNKFAEDYERGQVRGKSDIQKGVDAVVERMKHGSDHTQACYAAAITADPTYKPAWFRLSKFGNEEAAREALNELQRLDPENALLDYLQAAKAMKVGDSSEALNCVQRGNSKPACRLYPNRLPKKFHLRYSNEESFRKAGISGKRIPASGFAYLVLKVEQMWAWSDPLPGELRQVARELIDVAECMTQAEELADAETHLLAIKEMGWLLMAEETGDLNLTTTGFFLIRTVQEPLTNLYRTSSQPDKLANHQRLMEACQRASDELSNVFDKLKPSDDDVRRILLGEKDAIAEETESIRSALRIAVTEE
jgi:tetratricopeptide (TPR) repeat protein